MPKNKMSDFTEEDVIVKTGHLHMGLIKWAPDDKSAEVLKKNDKAKSKATIALMTAANTISHILNTEGPIEELLVLLENFGSRVEEVSEIIKTESRRIEKSRHAVVPTRS